MTEIQDRQLVKRALQGDINAFTALAERYCNKTLFDCARGYPLLRLAQQEAVRQALYADLTCYGCGPEEARQKTAAIIPLFARVLRAYY